MSPSRTIYFGYGSNLWLHQMRQRCPESTYMGVGMLMGWRLQINERGYCNVVETRGTAPTTLPAAAGEVKTAGVVYGLVYSLSDQDEDRLDVNEGVPHAYTKQVMTINFWASRDQTPVDVSLRPDLVRMLVYVDKCRITDSEPKTEYIYRMNMGITDALKMGVPAGYVQNVIREFIPEEATMNQEDKEEAEQQAIDFKDR